MIDSSKICGLDMMAIEAYINKDVGIWPKIPLPYDAITRPFLKLTHSFSI
jgi:hypothetical protein